MASSTHYRWADMKPEQMNPHTTRQYITGANTTVARVGLKKDAVVAEHHHFHEQISYILEGSIKFLIDGKEVIVKAGEVLCIPPHLPHGVVSLEDSMVLDIFNPTRQDWIDGDDAYLRVGAPAKS